MRIALRHVLNVIPFLVCFCFSPVGSGVDVSNTSDINNDDIEDQSLSIDIQFKKKNPKDLFLFLVINEQGKRLILCFQSVSISAIFRIRFKCLLSVVRVILSYACSCRLNFLIHCS
jgi:hypothetical protein